MKIQLFDCNFPGCSEKMSEDSAMYTKRYSYIPVVVCPKHFKVMQSGETVASNYLKKNNEKTEKFTMRVLQEFKLIGI